MGDADARGSIEQSGGLHELSAACNASFTSFWHSLLTVKHQR